MELCGGEALDHTHGFTAAWTVPEFAFGQGRGRKRFATLCCEQCSGQGQQLFAEAVRQQAVVADAHEVPGQDMQEESAQELRSEEHTSELQSRQYLVCR